MDHDFDVQVRGAGIVGRCLALALARAGLRVALAATPAAEAAGNGADGEDVRAYALNAASVELLRGLRVWDALAPGAVTPVHDMRVEGDRAGTSLEFSAWRQAVPALAWIVDAAVLERELASAVRFAPHIEAVARDIGAPLTAFCDGRDSAGREGMGVAFERVDYGQRAIAARLVADRPHLGVARQWFGAPDVLALLPFDRPEAGRSYALVWSLPSDSAARLERLDPTAFELELAQATHGAAGTLRLASPRASWPLARAAAATWTGPCWALLGDAAHVVHPLAGQGANLGLADVSALVRVLAEREPWRSPGDARLLRRYARERAAPTRAMLEATDGLWRLFAEPGTLLAGLRNRGLDMVDRATPLKRWLTARALGATSRL